MESDLFPGFGLQNCIIPGCGTLLSWASNNHPEHLCDANFFTLNFTSQFFLPFQVIINVMLFQCIKKLQQVWVLVCLSVCLWLMETERVCSLRVHWDSICVPEFPWICSTPWGVSSNGWWVILWYITVYFPAQSSLIIHKTHTQSSISISTPYYRHLQYQYEPHTHLK